MPYTLPPSSFSAKNRGYMQRFYQGILKDMQSFGKLPVLSKLPANPVKGLYVFDTAITGHPIITKAGTYSFDGANWTGPVDEQFFGDGRIADVSVSKLLAGTLGAIEIILANTASSIIKSANYVAGSAGWAIRGDGYAEVFNALIRGTLNAADITVGLVQTGQMASSGSNLIANSNFDTGDFTNWRKWTGTTQISVSTSPPTGCPTKNCCAFTYVNSATTAIFAAQKAYSDAGADRDGFEVAKDQEYAVSIWMAKSSGLVCPTIIVRVYYLLNDDTYTTYADIVTTNATTLTTAWQEFTGSFVIPTGGRRCWMYILAASQSAGSIYFTQLRVWRKVSNQLIVNGAVTADSIAADSIKGIHISATEITVDKLVMGASNLIANSNFDTGDTKGWSKYSGATYSSVVAKGATGVPTGAPTINVCKYSYTGTALSVSMWACAAAFNQANANQNGYEVTAGQAYSVSIYAAKDSSYASASGFRVLCYFLKGDGTYTTLVDVITKTAAALTTSWVEYTGGCIVPAGAVRMWPYVMSHGQTAGSVFFTQLRVMRKMDTSLVIDGLITADSAIVESLSASKLTTGTINAGTITVSNLNATNLTTGSINGSRFGTDTITGNPIAGRAVHGYAGSNASVTMVYNTASTLQSGSNYLGPFNLAQNLYRDAVFLIANFGAQEVAGKQGKIFAQFCKGGGTPGDAMSGCKVAQGVLENAIPQVTCMRMDTSPGTGALEYYVGCHQDIKSGSASLGIPYNVLILELCKT